jgi:hydrogenase accessory protein HypB
MTTTTRMSAGWGTSITTTATAPDTSTCTRTSTPVVEGDQQTSNDADRIRATGAPAVQVNTGKGCHLEAPMVSRALERLPLAAGGVLFIENVGNLVCPALFDLGEAHKVAILSVTEGEDKPLKYPDMFRAASLMLVNKVDLLPYLDFDIDLCEANARQVNPGSRSSASRRRPARAWTPGSRGSSAPPAEGPRAGAGRRVPALRLPHRQRGRACRVRQERRRGGRPRDRG